MSDHAVREINIRESVSAYLVRHIVTGQQYAMSFVELKHATRFLIREYYADYEEALNSLKEGFEMSVGQSAGAGLLELLVDGVADHYAEKIFVSQHHHQQYRMFAHTIMSHPQNLEILRGELERRSVLMFTGHYGAVDFLPSFLSIQGLPTSVLLRFKTEQARRGAFHALHQDASDLDLDLVDLSGFIAPALLRLRKQARILVTVMDAFDHWKAERGRSISLLGRDIFSDSTPKRLVELLNNPLICFAYVQRHGIHGYEFKLHRVEDDGSSLTQQLVRIWQQQLLRDPTQFYAWEELKNLLSNTSACEVQPTMSSGS
ncbi:MAG: hypothetical protein ACFCU3_03605 [Verrucomicrobiales bacterium]